MVCQNFIRTSRNFIKVQQKHLTKPSTCLKNLAVLPQVLRIESNNCINFCNLAKQRKNSKVKEFKDFSSNWLQHKTFTYSKSTNKTLGKGVKHIQS